MKVTNFNKSKIRVRIDSLMGEQRSYEERINLIGAQINVLLEAENILRGPAGAASKVAATAMALEPQQEQEIGNGPVNWKGFDKASIKGLSKVRSIAELLRYAGVPVSVKELGQQAARLGVTRNGVNSPRLMAEVSATICVSPLFKRVDRGVYELA